MPGVSVYFSLGSNLGDRERNIREAVSRMDKAFGKRRTALSSLIETEPFGFSGEKFLNAVVYYRLPVGEFVEPPAFDSTQGPEEILRTVKAIERAMGRTDPPEYDEEGNRIYHSRIIDIDILFYGTETVDTPELTIPHKGIAERDFVLIPLREIARPALKKAFPEYFDTTLKSKD